MALLVLFACLFCLFSSHRSWFLKRLLSLSFLLSFLLSVLLSFLLSFLLSLSLWPSFVVDVVAVVDVAAAVAVVDVVVHKVASFGGCMKE